MKSSLKVGTILNQDVNNLEVPKNINIKNLVKGYLEEELGIEAAEYFINDGNIRLLSDEENIPDDEHKMQRTVINNFFVNLLYQFRSISDVCTLHVLPYLTIQGRSEDWIMLFKSFVLPFLKQHQVFKALRSL